MEWLETLVSAAQEQLGTRAREALYLRGVTDNQIELFRLGYLNQKLPELPDANNFLEWSLHGRKLEDVFVLPLTNSRGQIRGVQFRAVSREKKGYTDYITSKEEAILFGLGQALPAIWETESVFLVEGAFDLFPIQRVYPNIVATLTDRISAPFGRLLRRLVGEIWLGYDMDKPGREARQRVCEEYGQDFTIHDVRYPRIPGRRSKDPAELWEIWGDDRLGVFLRRLKDPYYRQE